LRAENGDQRTEAIQLAPITGKSKFRGAANGGDPVSGSPTRRDRWADVKAGDKKEARQDAKEVKTDRKDLRQDRADRRKDVRDIRKDARK